MANRAPSLPTRFPCWCRATYSWGGETKRDLGFVEGDLIECLNAGDGAWWMGRLYRDKRATGLFPSNFVQVMDESFRPMSRATSPMPFANGGSVSRTSTPQKAKTFRKPFQAYAKATSPNPSPNQVATSAAEARSRGPSPSPNREPPYLRGPQVPAAGHKAALASRAPSPAPLARYPERTQAPSFGPDAVYGSRVPSPAPPNRYSHTPTNGYSSSQPEIGSSPPPPAPPPHRVAYNASAPRRTPSPSPSMNNRYPSISRAPSPASRSHMAPGLTPSPLRDAMEDVMSSLHDMTLRRDVPSPSSEQEQQSIDPWSPEAFQELQRKPYARERRRPRSSLGIGSSHMDEDYRGDDIYANQRDFLENDDSGHNPYMSEYSQRMEDRRQATQDDKSSASDELFLPENKMDPPPPPPKKDPPYQPRANSSLGMIGMRSGSTGSRRKLRNRKSAYELGREMIGRTFTTKSSATNSSSGVQSIATDGTSSTQRTSQSIMSGYSAGGFSATSAGSFARRKGLDSISRSRPMSVADNRLDALPGLGDAPHRGSQTPLIGSSNSSNHDLRQESAGPVNWIFSVADSGGVFGGLTAPKARKSGFFKKLVESAKTGAASARSSIAAGQMEAPRSPIKNLLPNGLTAVAGGAAARDMGLGGGKSGVDWVQVRRDINRSNSLSRNERADRIERCQLMNYPVIAPVDALLEVAEGDEGADGLPIEQPTDFQTVNLQLVDKSARFVNSLPPFTNPASLAQGYVCRPYRSDVQRLRAIFTWVSEKVAWDEDFEGEVDSRRVIQMKRGCAEEVAVLVMEMCLAMGLHAEVVRGYLKIPGEQADYDSRPRPNHWWNAVIVDNEWRIIDCSLASPTNPKRGLYSSAGCQVAETGWFLARPMEICYTHIPMLPQQQRICPSVAPDILLALPCACPPYFRNGIQLIDYDTSLTRLENLEIVHIQLVVPSDIECFAEVETRTYSRDADGDVFESGDTTATRALTQAEWIGSQKRYTVKAFLTGDDGQGTLKVYSGKRGLMHSIKDNPHPLTFTLPISHTGTNPSYDFFIRHPTPHAQRHDLYVAQPQCVRLAVNNTFVFAVRQHPSSLSRNSPSPDTTFARPSSAMSMISNTTSTTDYFSQASSSSSHSALQQSKPAKLAIQAPSGKILRLMRKSDNAISTMEAADGGVWETIIKIGERGTWRGLVLADRSARWCVFGEWECV
ncbi:cytokinesis protein 3 [Sticta canariensis]|nr:cytokinesis protein 3 [Sticta canariensis]